MGQDRDRPPRRDRESNRRGSMSRAQDRSSMPDTQASAESDIPVFQATRLIGFPIRLSDGERLGFVEDFIVDNAGRVPFIISTVDNEDIVIPFAAISFNRFSRGSLMLDFPIDIVDGVPRLTNLAQLSDPKFQERLVSFFQDTAGLNGIVPVRMAPQEMRLGTSLLGTNMQSLDGRTVGSLGDLIIDQTGQIQFVTTAFDGSLLPIPFSGLNLGDFRPGFVSLWIPSS